LAGDVADASHQLVLGGCLEQGFFSVLFQTFRQAEVNLPDKVIEVR